MARFGGGELRAPVFNDENFDFWQIKMKTIFRSQELWNLVENGYETPMKKEEELTEVEKRLMRDNVVKDARALGIIQCAVLNQIFPKIATQKSEKATWDILRQEFIGDKFNGQANNGKYQKNSKSKRKQWSNKAGVPVKNEVNNIGDKCKFYDRLHYGECWVKNKVKCHKCNKIEHIARYCNTNRDVQQVNFAHRVEETGNLFYAKHFGKVKKISDVWYIDSGCSNHMTSREDLLVDIDRNVKAKVQVSSGVLVEVAGNWTLVIETMKGKRYIKEMTLVPGLVENLLSVGQMIEHGYFFLFGDYIMDAFDDRFLSNLVVPTVSGNRYFLTFIDDNSRMCWIYLMRNKSEVTVSRDVVFNENEKCNWEENKVKEVCVPLISPEFRETNEDESGSSFRSKSPTSSERSSIQSTRVLVDTKAFNSTPLKWRILSEVYGHYNLCIIELECFDDAAQDEAWKVAMQ
ncbi:uncharacterized protein LOC125472648 [Pyrus x bretschneideri]|uniref:uncharacterized protein LOC125472648 n=1 Tax=Pyrus x bretschneideri TaxID=225117 RepID=UPI00202FF98E|nr:uncharacterized protein LOC125472648 [Pyrus x bretschneideri]